MGDVTLAILFPGQGSQSVGMLSELGEAHAIVKQTFAEASDILGYDLWALAQTGPAEKIKQTQYTQPLMYTSGVALWRLWNEQSGLKPQVVAGHSLGEFCALTAADAISFEQCLPLVQTRAQLMADAVPDGEGGMAAILGMDDEDVVAVCRSVTGERVVEAVNFNSTGQVAISGHLDAVEKACELAREKGARKAVLLPVSVPNHSSLMREAGDSLAQKIDACTINMPSIPVMQNTHAQLAADQAALLAALKAHVYSPVKWTQSYQAIMADFSPSCVVELGPGKVLAGLGKRIDRSVTVLPVEHADSLQKALDAVSGAA